MSKSVKFSVLGKGFIGQKHIFFIEEDEQAQLVSTIDPNPETAADFSTIQDFIRHDLGKTDVVCIATPNALHSEQAIELLDAGYHVVIEKPMAIKADRAEEVLKASIRNDRLVFVVMQNRYSPLSRWLKDIVDSGILGKLYMVQVNCFWNRDDRYYGKNSWHGSADLDGGTLYTQFSHFIDMLYWCWGDVKNIRSRFFDFNHGHSTEIEDSGFIGFEFVKGGIGQFNYSTSCYERNLESTITILAEFGTIKLGGQYMDQVLRCDIKDFEYEEVQAYTAEFGKYKGNAANHRFMVQNVIQTINGSQLVDTNVLEGLKVVEIIERIYKA